MDLELLMNMIPMLVLSFILLVFFGSFLFAFLRGAPAKAFLDRTRQKIQLIDKIRLSSNSYRLRFQLPGRNLRLGIPPGNHIKIYAPNRLGKISGDWNGKPDMEASLNEVQRNYTPVTGDEFVGYVDIVIKVYNKTEEFPDGGKVSQYMNELEIADLIDIRGPYGLLKYIGCGNFSYGSRKLTQIKSVGLVAGGSGITPMIQLLRHCLRIQNDDLIFSLIFANKTEDDILMRDAIEELQIHFPKQFKFWYTISNKSVDKKWAYSVGYIDSAILKDHLPKPGDDSIVLLCGPPPMTENICKPFLTSLGWQSEKVITL